MGFSDKYHLSEFMNNHLILRVVKSRWNSFQVLVRILEDNETKKTCKFQFLSSLNLDFYQRNLFFFFIKPVKDIKDTQDALLAASQSLLKHHFFPYSLKVEIFFFLLLSYVVFFYVT